MKISRRYKIYLTIIIIVAVALTIRWVYYHNKWRTVDMKDDGYQISYPAHWFNSTHKATRGPVGDRISLEVSNFPFVNSIMIRLYHEHTKQIDASTLDQWQLELIRKDGDAFWKMASAQPSDVKNAPWVDVFWSELFTMPMPSIGVKATARTWIDDVGYQRELVTFACGNDIYGIELLAFKSQWEKGLEIFAKVLNSFRLLNETSLEHCSSPITN